MGYLKNKQTEQSDKRRLRRSSLNTDMPNANIPLMEYFADSKQFNYDVRKWSEDVHRLLVGNVRRLTGLQRVFLFKKMRGYKASMSAQKARPASLVNSIKLSTRKNGYMGQIDRIGYQFPVHGIWLHHGVSRGHTASNPRRKVDWFNSVLEARISALADISTKYFGDAILNYHRLKIK